MRRQQLIDFGQQVEGIQRPDQGTDGHTGVAFFQRGNGAGSHPGQKGQITLAELLETRPLQQGLAELVAYLILAAEPGRAVIDDTLEERVSWLSRDGQRKSARLPRVIFSK